MGWHQGVRVSIGVVAAGAVLSGSIGNETRCREVRRGSAETVVARVIFSRSLRTQAAQGDRPRTHGKEGLPSRGL